MKNGFFNSYNKDYLKNLLLVSLIVLTSLSLFYSCQSAEQISKDIEVIDGDTLKFNGKTVRIIGIDAPETYSGGSKPVGEFGQDAKNYLYWFAANHTISIEPKGTDSYGRVLAYVFGTDSTGKKHLYEASLTELGYARPLLYRENYVASYTQGIIDAYKRAYENKRGIYSKLDNAPVITNKSNWTSYVGKIVYLEMQVSNVYKYSGTWYIVSDFAVIKIREDEYTYIFSNYNLYSLKNRVVRFYGELWNDEGKPTIMLRAPWEINVLN